MVKAMREQIIAWGGEVRFGAKLTKLQLAANQVVGVEVNDEEIIPTSLVLAGVGHSARDTYEMLYNTGIAMESKPFAVGVRIEHPQSMIDISQYGIEPAELGLGRRNTLLSTMIKKPGVRRTASVCARAVKWWPPRRKTVTWLRTA